MSILPKKLAIYYGIPSLINDASGNINTSVNTFKDYDQIVLGAGLEENSHSDHNNTITIINHSLMVNTQVFGEIDSTIALNIFKNKVDKWKNMGVKGIFCNKFGYDFLITRQKQNNIIDYIHSKSLIAFVNAWNIQDVFSNTINLISNPLGLNSTINSNDWYLAQSYQIINGNYQQVNDWKTKADLMIQYNQQFGTKMACVTTTDNSIFNQHKMDYSYYSTVLYGFHSFGWGEFNFSATSSLLPFRTRKIFYGTKHIGGIINNGNIYDRRTNIGIHLNTTTHTVNILLD